MKNKLLLLIVFTTGFISCKKDSVENSNGFTSFVESDIDYTTRSCLQLSDGNYVVCGSSELWPAGNSLFGKSYSVMAKFSQTGDLIWQKNLPVTLCDLWKGISLPEGGFILTGFDNMPENTNITINLYNNNGGLVKSNQFVNYTGTGKSSGNQVDICRLSNGNIAMVLIDYTQGDKVSCPRLLIFDQQLNIITDKVYTSMLSSVKNYKMMRITEGNNGNIYICGRTQEFNAWSWTFLMGVNGTNFDRNFFTEKIGNDTTAYPGPLVVNDEGHVIITSAEQFRAGIYFNIANYFYYHPDEYFSIGTTVSALEIDANGNYIDRHKYSGFPGYASLTGITMANDGGFLFVGTSNIETNEVLNSHFQMLLIKTNFRLEKEWIKTINTTYPAVAVDVKSTNDGGFLIGAYEKSFNKNYKMMLIKTDANGNM